MRARRLLPLSESARAAIPADLRACEREWLGFVPIGYDGRAGTFTLVGWGTRNRVCVDPAELFLRVLALRPGAFFLFHPHPSGALAPSPEDFDLTRRVGEVGRALGIPLLGHGIVAGERVGWIPTEARLPSEGERFMTGARCRPPLSPS